VVMGVEARVVEERVAAVRMAAEKGKAAESVPAAMAGVTTRRRRRRAGRRWRWRG
jgi:hypothetical protein